MEKVVVAMSGGVDSSVSAALLKAQGYEVIGIMLRLWSEKNGSQNKCCSPNSAEEAATVADILGIPFYMLDYRDAFKKTVVDYFIESYTDGITPNPCVICNKEIRFGQLMQEAMDLDAHYLATGHYAQIEKAPSGALKLKKGIDPTKDQSYMLFRLNQKQLSRALFPVGGYLKSKIREIAKEFGLPVHRKSDSQDLCFLGDDGQAGFIQRHAPAASIPGPIVNRLHKVIGTHKGLTSYTVGQRKGLGIADAEPLYVLEIDKKKNQLMVGAQNECLTNSIRLKQLSFIDKPPFLGEPLKIQTRYRSQEQIATIALLDKQGMKLKLSSPAPAPSPGQALVMYREDQVIGGGIIQKNEGMNITPKNLSTD